MKYDLASMSRRNGNRKTLTVFRPIRTTQAQARALAEIYRQMLEPIVSAHSRIVEDYARELHRVLTTDSPEEMADLFEEIGAAVERLVLELTPALRNWAIRTEGYHRRKWRDTVLAGASVDLQYLIGPQDVTETLATFIQRNVALVRDISSQARGRIADAVFRGLQRRTPTREVAKEIAKATGMARRRALNVAADQSVKLASALDAQRQREAGLTVWRWNHSDKKNPREEHKARDGFLYADEAGDRGKVGTSTIRKPPDDRPGELPWCGCIRQACLVLNGEIL